jgi:competence protein ComEC
MPFLRITSLFLTGILISRQQVFYPRISALLILVLISVQLFWWFAGDYSKIRVQNIILVLLLILSGTFYPEINSRMVPEFDRKDYFLAEVCQKPVEKPKTFQTILKIQNNQMKRPEDILAYFAKNSFDTRLNIGDQMIILVKPQLITNRNNPFEFDFQSFVRKHSVWFSAYLADGTWMKTGRHVRRLSNLSEQVRQKLLTTLAAQIRDKEERSVVEALTLGYREELDPETKDYFSSTGAMHVLAVSGLHVGLIYWILNVLLGGLRRWKAGQHAVPVVLVGLLWGYAFLTGFSPSVQRATVMFSFVIIGNAIRRPVNIFNSLAASALVLVLIRPDVIFEVGFQLSYLAVFGIVLIQPKLAAFVSPQNKIIRAVWELFTVSVAAQMATFPLGLLYFNQMSNLFWVSNFIVIPAATVLIWATFLFFVFSFVPLVSGFFAFLLKWVTHAMILALKYLSKLPLAVTDGIVITTPQVWMMYGALASFFIFLFSKQKQWLFSGLIFVLMFQLTNLNINLKLFNQRAVIAYNCPSRLIHFINGRRNYLVTTTDSLTGYEFEMVKKVQVHLKLDKPRLISGKLAGRFASDDVSFENREFRFLNCRINLPTRQTSGKIRVAIDTNAESSGWLQTTIERSDSAYLFSLTKKPIPFITPRKYLSPAGQ